MLLPALSYEINESLGPGVSIPGPAFPVAAFSFIGNVSDELAVDFTDESTGGAVEWLYDFGDGDFSYVQHPTHHYSAPGTYQAKLTARTAAGLAISIVHEVTVPTIASLSARITAAAGKMLVLPPGTYELDETVVAPNTAMIVMQKGAVITVPVTRELGTSVHWMGGQIQPANGVAVTLSGRQDLPLNHHAFDISLGGTVQIKATACHQLAPENFGAKNDDATWDDLALRAFYAALEWDASANRCIQGRYLPGNGYLHGLLAEVIEVDWGGTSHFEFVTCRMQKSGMVCEGPGPAAGSFHFKPAPAWVTGFSYPLSSVVAAGGNLYVATIAGVSGAGPSGTGTGIVDGTVTWDFVCVDDPWFNGHWSHRIERSNQINHAGIERMLFRAGGDTTRTKYAVHFHDVRFSRFRDLLVNNWGDVYSFSRGIVFGGRDASLGQGLKSEAPIWFDYNHDETAGRDADGIPLAFRDNKDTDHWIFDSVDVAADDSPRKATIIWSPGCVWRNIEIRELTSLGGAPTCVDRADAPPIAVEAVNATTNAFQATGHKFETGDQLQLWLASGAVAPTVAAGSPIDGVTFYFAIRVDANNVKLARTLDDAIAGTAIDLTSTGSGGMRFSPAVFRGTVVVPRRRRNQLKISGGRTEKGPAQGFDSRVGCAGIRLELHPNGKLLEFKLEQYQLGEGSDARRFETTGAQSKQGVAWDGLTLLGVLRIVLDGDVRFGGSGIPLRVDAHALVSFDTDQHGRPMAELVPSDFNRRMPENEAHWDFIKKFEAPTIIVPQHFWLLNEDTQSVPCEDGQSSGTDRDLRDTGTVRPVYATLVDNFHKYGIRFTEQTNQGLKLYQASDTPSADTDPATEHQLVGGDWVLDAGWVPGGNRDLHNLGGDNAGPVVRINPAGNLYVRANTTEGTPSILTYNDGVPFLLLGGIDHDATTIEYLLVKADGTWEIISVTYTTTNLLNTVNQGSGASTTGMTSPMGTLLYKLRAHGAAAQQSKQALAEARGWRLLQQAA